MNFKNEIQNGLHLFQGERKAWILCREGYFRFCTRKGGHNPVLKICRTPSGCRKNILDTQGAALG
jgi:hypothetical protein